MQIIWRTKLAHLVGKEEQIIDQHVLQKISIAALAEMYECDRKPIQNIIKKNGHNLRSSISPKLDGRETEIIDWYVTDLLTIQTICKRIGCSYGAIERLLKRSNIKIRKSEESRRTENGKVKSSPRRLTNQDQLNDAINQYNNGGTLKEIGNKYNITASGLRVKFLKLGVELRTLSESANLPSTNNRKKDTNIARFGVENPMQNPDVYEKSNTNRYKFKSVVIDGRQFTHLQGFEEQGIRYLIENFNIDVNQIRFGRKVPIVRYEFEEKNKIYYPDLFIPNKNLLVEIKCDYTYNNMLALNITKREYAISKGYNYITLIFNNKGTDISEIIEFNHSDSL
jgi:predicted DNA-binding protein YlxM (UPF0122 family)